VTFEVSISFLFYLHAVGALNVCISHICSVATDFSEEPAKRSQVKIVIRVEGEEL
jgi:hypothetical protein